MDTLKNMLNKTIDYIHSLGIEEIEVGLILGSGLGDLAEDIEQETIISYSDIPHFPIATVDGHSGQLVYGVLSGKKVLAMKGRFHYYEGYFMQTATYPVRVMKALGAKSLIVTNASGGVNESYKQGDLMLITDHINYTGSNPLIGTNDDTLGPRFPDMNQAYDNDYQTLFEEAAAEQNVSIQKGVYMGFSGPSYETPAEIRFARSIGADAVGMSTIPEVIVAIHAGLRILGVSCITNMAAGLQNELNHVEVVETTERVKEEFKALIKNTLARM